MTKKSEIENSAQDQNRAILTGEALYWWLVRLFGNKELVTEKEFRKTMQISPYQMYELRLKGCAPEMIVLNGGTGAGRYLVADIAKWVEKTRAQNRATNPDGSSKCGRRRKNPLHILDEAVA